MSSESYTDAIIPFRSDEEAEKHRRWVEESFNNGTLMAQMKHSDEQDCANSEKPLGAFDMASVINELNKPTESHMITTTTRSMAPMPTIAGYNNTPIPQYTGIGKPRITATALKSKVLMSCRIFVKNGTIFYYDGKCYQALDNEQAKQLIYAICESEIYEHGRFDLVTGTLSFILSEPRIQLKDDVINRRILTFQNGNLDIETGMLTPHTPDVFTAYALFCNYIPDCENAPCPVFDKLLYDISGGDAEIEARIWEMFGYCLSPDIGAKKGFVLQGRKHSGKTLICNLLESFFPQSVISALDAHDFSQRFALSELEGKALCVSGDMPAEPLSERIVGHIKKLPGNDLISAAKKHQNNRQFRFGGKLILVSNNQILPKKYDDAFFDRFVAIPFPYTTPPELQDIYLIEKLKGERDVIASKAIKSYWNLKQRFYHFSGEYSINSGSFLLDLAHENVAIAPLVEEFLKKYFEPAPYDEGVFIEDAHALFNALFKQNIPHIDIEINQFGRYFGNMAVGTLNAKRDRKRKPSDINAKSYLHGVRMSFVESA